MIVRSFERFAEVADFDPAAGRPLGGRRLLAEPDAIFGAQGFYATLSGHDAVFYRAGGELRLWLHDRAWPLATSAVTWELHDRRAELRVTDAEGASASVVYEPAAMVADDPTPFVDEEDWDFGLFVSNVVNDPERAARILHGA